MKLAFSSNAYMHFSIEDTIKKIAGLGYTGIEILADVPHAWPAGLLEERKVSIRRHLEKHRLTISNVNASLCCKGGLSAPWYSHAATCAKLASSRRASPSWV